MLADTEVIAHSALAVASKTYSYFPTKNQLDDGSGTRNPVGQRFMTRLDDIGLAVLHFHPFRIGFFSLLKSNPQVASIASRRPRAGCRDLRWPSEGT